MATTRRSVSTPPTSSPSALGRGAPPVAEHPPIVAARATVITPSKGFVLIFTLAWCPSPHLGFNPSDLLLYRFRRRTLGVSGGFLPPLGVRFEYAVTHARAFTEQHGSLAFLDLRGVTAAQAALDWPLVERWPSPHGFLEAA